MKAVLHPAQLRRIRGFNIPWLTRRTGIFLASLNCYKVKMWRASDGSLEQELGGSHFVSSISFSPNGKLMALGCRDNGGVRLRTMNNKCVAVHNFEEDVAGDSTASFQPVAFSPNGQTVAAGGEVLFEGDCILLWDIRKSM
jgi:WD40 repeat protein